VFVYSYDFDIGVFLTPLCDVCQFLLFAYRNFRGGFDVPLPDYEALVCRDIRPRPVVIEMTVTAQQQYRLYAVAILSKLSARHP